jgi:hypothetical protein
MIKKLKISPMLQSVGARGRKNIALNNYITLSPAFQDSQQQELVN